MESPTATSNSAAQGVVDPTPLLANSAAARDNEMNRRLPRRPSLRGAARFLRRASTRRIMREPSMLVRETAAEQLEERQSDWAYSRPVVVLDIVWNLAFVVVAVVVLVLSRDESPSMPLRLWIVGYALQCVLHMVCVCVEYRRRLAASDEQSGSRRGGSPVSGRRQDVEEAGVHDDSEQSQNGERTRLCIIFLAFDVFFVVFCVALACVIGIAVCCCLPCIIAILYAVADQEGASDEDIRQLPKYKFRKVGDFEKLDGEISGSSGGIMTECGIDMPMEHVLSAEDAECCICLSGYEDGVELRELPCTHHFHCSCIDKWLYMNATCPLCKFNIIKAANHVEPIRSWCADMIVAILLRLVEFMHVMFASCAQIWACRFVVVWRSKGIFLVANQSYWLGHGTESEVRILCFSPRTQLHIVGIHYTLYPDGRFVMYGIVFLERGSTDLQVICSRISASAEAVLLDA
ncbi:hypothetical protein ACLOJK_006188 [Asimina triloba]